MSLAFHPLSPQVISTLNGAVVADVMLYGVHAVLFALYLYTLKLSAPSVFSNHDTSATTNAGTGTRQSSRSRCSLKRPPPSFWINVSCAILLFALSTADVGITIQLFVSELPFLPRTFQGSASLNEGLRPRTIIFVVNNFVADFTLLYRSYVVWNRSKYVLLFVGFLVLVDTVLGIFSMGIFVVIKLVPVYWGIILALNVLITLITVGRIVWVGKLGQSILSSRKRKHYFKIMAILLETSLIYSIFLLAFVILPFERLEKLLLASLCFRMVSIMPTLLLVQVGLSNLSHARRNHHQHSNGPTDSSDPSSSGFRSRNYTSARNDLTSNIVLDTLITTAGAAQVESQRSSHENGDSAGNGVSFVVEEGRRVSKSEDLGGSKRAGSPESDRVLEREVKGTLPS